MVIYPLIGSWKMLAELAESGEIDEQIYQDTKESLMANIEAEAENGAKAMKQLEGEAEVLDKEIKRLKALKDAKEATKHAIEEAEARRKAEDDEADQKRLEEKAAKRALYFESS